MRTIVLLALISHVFLHDSKRSGTTGNLEGAVLLSRKWRNFLKKDVQKSWEESVMREERRSAPWWTSVPT